MPSDQCILSYSLDLDNVGFCNGFVLIVLIFIDFVKPLYSLQPPSSNFLHVPLIKHPSFTSYTHFNNYKLL